MTYSIICSVVKQIPEGYVATYGQVAALAGLPKHARMVSKAMRACSDTLPWHRVIKGNGLIAFPEDSVLGVTQKSRLISEGVIVNNMRINLNEYGWQPDFL